MPDAEEMTLTGASTPGGAADFAPEREPHLPDRPDVIRASEPDLGAAEMELVTAVLQKGWVSGRTPIIEECERAFAAAVGVREAVACNSGGSALQLLLRAAGVGAGDEVIVPAYTMVATAGAVSLVGGTPLFVDCDPGTLNITAAGIRAAITPRCKAVIAVHLYGHPCAMDEIRQVCDEGGLLLFEDAAEAHGASWKGRACGSLGHAGAFGFYGNKTITAGEGGMITTDDAALASRIRSLRSYCFGAERHYWHDDVGFSMRMGALQAALVLAQIRRLDELVARRRAVAANYDSLLDEHCPGITRNPTATPDANSSRWFYWIRVSDRPKLREALAAEGIETRPGFVPLHRQPCYAADRWPSRSAPEGNRESELAGREVLLLPTHSKLTLADQQRIVEALCRHLA
jgi:perosamine synthetase